MAMVPSWFECEIP